MAARPSWTYRRSLSAMVEPHAVPAPAAWRAPIDLSGRSCIVTGGGQGIGRAIVRTFVAHGANVVIADNSHTRCEEAANEVISCGGRALAVCADIGDRDDIDDLVRRSERELGGVDVVVH